MIRALCGLFVVSVFVLPAVVKAQDNFFAGKTIELVLPASAGGAYGLYGTFLSEEFSAFIPGEPTILPNFMGGAGGMRASNFVGSVAATDGTVLYMMHQSAPTSQLLSPDAARYDAGAFQPIGVVSSMNSVMVVRNDVGMSGIGDATEAEVVLGSTGRGSYQFIVPTLMNSFMDTHFRVVTTYGGTGETFLAMERGEIDGLMTSISTITQRHPTWIDGTGDASVVLQVGTAPDPTIPDVPLLTDLATDVEQREAYEFLSASNGFARSLVAPAGVPEEVVTILRIALSEMLADEGVQARAAERGITLESSDAETLGTLIKNVLTTNPAILEMTEAIMRE